MTLDNFKQRVDRLSPTKRVLLEKRLRGPGINSSVAIGTIPRRQSGEISPVSFGQERLWFLNQLEPDSPAYNEPRALRLTGLLDIAALDRTLNTIIHRHETLRTTFVMIDGMPVQRIAEHHDIELPLFDLQQMNDNERDAEARRLIDETILKPFDLSKDCVLRIVLLRLSEKEHILILVNHHIGSDAWSSGIFWHEFATLYESFSSGQAAELPELPIQYADFAAWQREWLQGDNLENQLSYWRKQLTELSPLRLLTDRPRPDSLNPRGAIQGFSLSKEVSAALKALSRGEGMTLFTALLAAFQALLYRYTDQDDIAVGSPIAGRNRREIEGLIGFFANTLILRTDLTNNPTFREILARVRVICLNAYSHQDLPFEKIVAELHPERSLSQNPLFQVTFQLNSNPRKPLTLPWLQLEPVASEHHLSKFDLSLSMTDREESISGHMIYSTDLFEAPTIERMLGHFQTLLEGIVANPDQRIGDLPLLTEAEKHQILVEWNDTKTEYPKDKCVHELFEAQVEKTPDAIAVVCEDQQVTYKELNHRANRLAHYLIRGGVQPETAVGICLERSVEMIVGLLGILKAGGAYVPLDPDYPQERLDFMLQDAHVHLLLTQQRLLSSTNHPNIVCLDSDWPNIAAESTDNPQSQVSADNLAYVIYTSGSTGTPKGVEVLHQGILRLLLGVNYAQLDSSQTLLQLAPVSFDAATFEIWGALLHGGKCVLFTGKVSDPRETGAVLQRYKVNTLWLTAALFNSVIDQEPKALSTVKQLLIGGEALSVPHVKKALTLLPNTRIINGYGPTESTTFTCCYTIPRQLDDELTSVPIGRPIANTQVYILDSHLNPVPIGARGELHIGGHGLARGYLNRPELTAERFITNPFSNDSESRLYKTGDLARYLPDGNIEFLGRIDNQVKIRGYRIELGEIEAVLGQHPAVQQVVVLAREDTPGDKRLVGYVVSDNGSAPSAHGLRSFLQQKLPEYMVPSAFVLLDSLPLTPNGKPDRKALSAPNHGRADLDDGFVAPRNRVEEILANIWAEILKVEKVGIHDNFFHLGGHSLLATQVVSRIINSFSTDLPLRDIFEAPTVAALAHRLQNHCIPNKGADQQSITRAVREHYKV